MKEVWCLDVGGSFHLSEGMCVRYGGVNAVTAALEIFGAVEIISLLQARGAVWRLALLLLLGGDHSVLDEGKCRYL